MGNTYAGAVVTVLNGQSGAWNKAYKVSMKSFGIYNCTEETTIVVTNEHGTQLTIVTDNAWDDIIYDGFRDIDITTTGTYDLVVRG